MEFWFGVGVIVVGIIVSIALHEIGHLVPAKLFGVRVTDYFVGFGKTLWSTKRGETEYGVKMLPLGGFVRMVGMFPPARAESTHATDRTGVRGWMDRAAQDARTFSAQEVVPGQEHRSFYALTVPRKLGVMFGGPVMNLIIATVLFAIILTTIGQLMPTNRLGSVSECVLPAGESRECTDTDRAAPARQGGLEPDDVIVSWGGTAVSGWEDVSEAIVQGGTGPAEVVVERAGEEVTLTVTPALEERPMVDDDGRPVLGPDGQVRTTQVPFVGISPAGELVRQPITAVPEVVWNVFSGTVRVVVTLPQRLVGITQSLLGNAERDPGVMGLIGVGRFAGEITSVELSDYGPAERTADMLSLIASLNMALFVFNMIPLLPLDGGHLAGALFEGARRRVAGLFGRADPGPVDTARLMPLTYVVVIVMIGMSLLLAVADIIDPITLT
ncbi:M50 family metallopeptidase [Pseudactinotalea sp. Z1739]|uniref:M50 family metallopeptidase n=1 Tax=Pseudactinotalea sp. Z1739 TaxID=3413028 RepID=UPI003C7D3A78